MSTPRVDALERVATAARALSEQLFKDSREAEESLPEDAQDFSDLTYGNEHKALLDALAALDATERRRDTMDDESRSVRRS